MAFGQDWIMAFDQDYGKLKSEHLTGKRTGLYEDPRFPAEPQSIEPKQSGEYSADIIWKRPNEILRDQGITQEPRFIVNDATRFDFDQGALGNCWFIAAAANLAASKKKLLLQRCVPDQNFTTDYAGIFRFQFWRFGKWTEVVVDDFLPTVNNQVYFGHNREEPNEFWAALFEKAYAKLHGCYDNLAGGKINDALVDFTGGLSEMFNLQNAPPDFQILQRTLHMNSMMGCSMSEICADTKKKGLYAHHAYSINKVAQVHYDGKEVDLVRLRNPWGETEWNGPWADASKEWKSISHAERTRMEDNGEFWMSYDDVKKYFDRLYMTHISPDALTDEVEDTEKRPWNPVIYHSSWVRGVSAGGCGNKPYEELYWTNPQFQITVKDTDDNVKDGSCTMIVSFIQKDKDRSRDLSISFGVFQLRSGEPKLPDGQNYDKDSLRIFKVTDTFRNMRERTKEFQVQPGTYIIIPSTYAPNKESEFILRIFTKK